MATQADSSVMIEIDANTSEAQKKIKTLEKEVAKMEGALSKKTAKRNALAEQANQASAALDAAKAKAEALRKENDRIVSALAPTSNASPEAYIEASGKKEQTGEELKAQEAMPQDMDLRKN